MSRRLKLFRWRAVGPLLLFLVILGVLYALCIDRIARGEVRHSLSQMLGTQVDLAGLTIRTADAAVDLAGLAIADPRNPRRNLLAADSITLDFDPVPLAEKKLVIDRLRLSGLRLLTARATPARPADPNGPAATLLRGAEAWAREKFQFPRLALARVDTLKRLVLDPGQLGSVQAAEALAARLDSVAAGVTGSLAGLNTRSLVDSATALADRVAALDVKRLDPLGAGELAATLRQTADGIRQARSRVRAVEDSVRAAVGGLRLGLEEVDAARERDYAMARGLLDLPSFAAPDIGAALFGAPSLDYFQQALYYATVLQRYVPPGLQPWNRPGPRRARQAGTTVEFPREEDYPAFLLRQGDLEAASGQGDRDRFRARLTGVTSQPALYGQPMRLAASGRLGGADPVTIELQGFSRHFGAAPADSVAAQVSGVPLPEFALPGLPFRLAPGRSTVGFAFSLAGDRLSGRWDVSADRVRWSRDSAAPAGRSPVENAVWQVVSGLARLQVRAELGGTIARPTLRVRSNLDEAVAARLRGLAGEALQRAEAEARAAVDRFAEAQLAGLTARMEGLKTQALDRLPVERGQLDAVERRLEDQLKRLTASAAGGLRLPKL